MPFVKTKEAKKTYTGLPRAASKPNQNFVLQKSNSL